MSSLSQAALERQIRPIYDALDASSNKSAIQQCNKVLKKYPNLDLVKALKALAIVRMNKVEESLPLCDEVLASKPTDLETLNAMMHVLRALGRHLDLVSMYDEAYRKQPGNEELGAQDFFANVRTGNWKSAQQIATRLYKSFKGDRYLYWSVIAATLQANDPVTPPNMRAILYKLAHRMLGGAETPAHSSADRLHVHLTILRELGMLEEATNLLDTLEGKAVAKTSLAVDELRRQINIEKGDLFKESEYAVAKLVKEGDRNWLNFLSILNATFSHVEKAEHIHKTEKLFHDLAQLDGNSDRSSLLALLELKKRTREANIPEHNVSEYNDFVKLINQYLEEFGGRTCCFEDLRPFVTLHGDELGTLITSIELQNQGYSDLLSLRRSINSHKLRRYTLRISEISSEHEEIRAFAYLRAYTAALPLGKTLPDTELQPADDLVLLTVQALINLWKIEDEIRWLFMAVSVLEYAVQRSKHSYLIRLHLVRIYNLLGAPLQALEHYHAMRVKQIQNDTLSHYILARASTFSLIGTGDLTFREECVEASQIYVSNSNETSDFIVRAFASEKYSQIPDFIAFEDRLDNSLQRDLVKVEHVRMRLVHEGASPELVDTELIELKFIFDRVHYDNRDFDVLPNYQPYGQESFNEQTLMLGNSPGLGWLMSFLRMYIRVFQLASDIDDTVEEKLLIGDRPKVIENSENKHPLKERLPERRDEELSELTKEELGLFDFIMTLCDWLSPYHDHARPPPEVVLAEANKQSELRAGPSQSKSSQSSSNGSSPRNGHKKISEEPPVVKDPPETVLRYFDDIAMRFKEVMNKPCLPSEPLHIATICQEAALLVALASIRFKTPAVVKANKFGALTQSLKTLRSKSIGVLKEMSSDLTKSSAQESTSEQRRSFVDACKPLQRLPEFEHDFLIDIAKKVGDARKRVIEGIGKGLSKVASHLP